MMKPQNNVASFVLRFTQEMWRDAQDEPHVQWRGHIRHVQGDEEDRFTDFAEAVAFIQRYLAQLTMEAIAGGQNMNQEKVLQESFKLWEQFASSYTGMMFEAMEQTVKQSQTFKEQIDQATQRALKAWQFSEQPDQKQVVEVLKSLQAQIEALTAKVETLEQALQAKDKETVSTDRPAE
ncbi:MAG: hypothetical protein HS126_09590 [Anaerolineales bacterium]|nr:hypothetical protein [Anaerolineales bacterium]